MSYMLVGCQLGSIYSHASRIPDSRAVLDLRTAGVAIVGSGTPLVESIASLEGRLVLWHLGLPESFFGFYDPARFAENPRPLPPGTTPKEDMCLPLAPDGPVAEVNGKDYHAVAAAVKIPPGGLLFLIRHSWIDWTVYTVTLEHGEKGERLSDYRRRLLAREGL